MAKGTDFVLLSIPPEKTPQRGMPTAQASIHRRWLQQQLNSVAGLQQALGIAQFQATTLTERLDATLRDGKEARALEIQAREALQATRVRTEHVLHDLCVETERLRVAQDYLRGKASWTSPTPQRGPSADTPLDQEVIRYTSEPSVFRPTWAKTRAPSTPSRAERMHETRRVDAQFRPAHVMRTAHQPNPKGARHHPYAQPAYGATSLRTDQVEHAKALARRLAKDRSQGRIDAPLNKLEEMALAVAEARADGVNPRTSSKDQFALREWEHFAELTGFDANTRSEWTRTFPEREGLKLASFLLFRAQRAVPRSKKDAVAKPMSIYHNYLALRRVFKSRDVELPPPGTVRETLRGLLKRFVRRFGIENLRPKRVEPVTPDLIRAVLAHARTGQARVKGHVWTLDLWVPFTVTAWMVINLSVGSRKGESTQLPGDVDGNDWFTRASVSFEIKGATVIDPDPDLLRRMREGDRALLAPKGSKCDTYGTCHGTEPIVLPYHEDELNAARWLKDIELKRPCRGASRNTTPLFADGNGNAFKDSTFSMLIMEVLAQVVGVNRAKLLSPHSWRVWLASSLRMCNASDARIQAFGRWLNPDSLRIYARISKQEYAEWIDKLMAVRRIDTARTTSLPIMDAADAIAVWGDQLKVEGSAMLDTWTDQPTTQQDPPPPPPLKPGDRVSVYWTDLDEWYHGTYTSSKVETADGGGKQRASRIVYDATGPWAQCSAKQLTYYHCLDDETWSKES